MKRVYVYLIFAHLIFAAKATGEKFLTVKISQSTVLVLLYVRHFHLLMAYESMAAQLP